MLKKEIITVVGSLFITMLMVGLFLISVLTIRSYTSSDGSKALNQPIELHKLHSIKSA